MMLNLILCALTDTMELNRELYHEKIKMQMLNKYKILLALRGCSYSVCREEVK